MDIQTGPHCEGITPVIASTGFELLILRVTRSFTMFAVRRDGAIDGIRRGVGFVVERSVQRSFACLPAELG